MASEKSLASPWRGIVMNSEFAPSPGAKFTFIAPRRYRAGHLSRSGQEEEEEDLGIPCQRKFAGPAVYNRADLSPIELWSRCWRLFAQQHALQQAEQRVTPGI